MFPAAATRARLCVISAATECARGIRTEPAILCLARCATTGLARTVVWNYQVRPALRSSDQMQDPHMARTCMQPAGDSRTLSEYQVWNRVQIVLLRTDLIIQHWRRHACIILPNRSPRKAIVVGADLQVHENCSNRRRPIETAALGAAGPDPGVPVRLQLTPHRH